MHVQRWFGLGLLVAAVLCVSACSDNKGNGGAGTGAVLPMAGTTSGGVGGTTGGVGGMTGGVGGMTGGVGGMTGGMGGSGGMTPVACGGRTCAAGEMCVANTCRKPCMNDMACMGGKCCTGFCADLDVDRGNCGACGTACDTSEMCSDGECEAATCIPMSDEDGGDDPEVGDNGCPENEECEVTSTGNVCVCGMGDGCPGGESCSSSGNCMCGDNPGCTGTSSCCGDECLNLNDDDDNCGDCGHECLGGSSCTAGTCTCPIASQTPCEDGCFDTDNDEDNCGACGNKCADGATCNDGECECDGANEIACDGECVPGNTNDNCGECGNACDPDADYTCRKPAGMPLDCYCFNVELSYCENAGGGDGACVDLDSDEDNCGECDDDCNAPANTCRDGVCECPIDGQSPCGNNCVDLQGDADNCGECGFECDGAGAPGTCTAGLCDCTNTSALFCDELANGTGRNDDVFQCIVPNTIWSCGDCGHRCIDAACTDGACDCAAANEDYCDGVGCVNQANDEENCGDCGRECPSGVTCTMGVCDCPGAASIQACTVDGDLKCIDTDTDKDNCGECGNDCGDGEECCDGECVDPDTDYGTRENCLFCGDTCGNDCGFLPGFPGACDCLAAGCE